MMVISGKDENTYVGNKVKFGNQEGSLRKDITDGLNIDGSNSEKEEDKDYIPKTKFSDKSKSTKGEAKDFDQRMQEKSEDDYSDIVNKIVHASIEQLDDQRANKKELRNQFTEFFVYFILLQFVVLVLLVIFNEIFCISDTVIVSLVTSFFVETLGALIIMIKFAFDTAQETAILKILNSVVENFQKFGKGK